MPWRLDAEAIEWIDEAYPDRRLDLSGAGDLVDALIDAATEDEIDELLDILGDEPDEEAVEKWKAEFWLLLKHLYVALALIGGAGELVFGDWEAVQLLLLFQLDYLDRFAQEVASGAVSPAEAGRRMRMYVNSARSAFWTVMDRKLVEAGYTEEQWEAIGDRNTCSPCTEADLMGWQPIGTFAQPGTGFVRLDPPSECAGLSSCRCRKLYR